MGYAFTAAFFTFVLAGVYGLAIDRLFAHAFLPLIQALGG